MKQELTKEGQKYRIWDTQNLHYFGIKWNPDMTGDGGAVFESLEEIRQQLISYHSIDAEDPRQLEEMSVAEILEYGQWDVHDLEGEEVEL